MSTNPFSAPPTNPNLAPLAPLSPRPIWPTVLGVIGLILGVLGALANFCGALGPAVTDWLSSHFPALSSANAAPKSPLLAVVSAVGMLVSILLCFASVELLQRRAVAVKHWRLWAWLKIAVAIIAAVMVIPYQSQSIRTAMEQANPSVQLSDRAVMLIAVAGVAVGLLFALFLPVFILIWFHRQKIRQQTALWP